MVRMALGRRLFLGTRWKLDYNQLKLAAVSKPRTSLEMCDGADLGTAYSQLGWAGVAPGAAC